MPVWGYTKTTGPHTWAVHFPAASGTKQSPINIDSAKSSNVEVVNGVSPMSWKYEEDACKRVVNTGQGWQLRTDSACPGEVSGGVLPRRYRLEQIHMHWGASCKEGSEHTINGKSYPGEIHLVHWDCEQFKSFSDAVAVPGGLTVLGVFLEVGATNPELQKIVDALGRIPHKSMESALDKPVNPAKILPDGSYWTYEGSLTTPPCLESVNWVLFKQASTISEEQLKAFRGMLTYSSEETTPDDDEFKGHCLQNFRPVMPLCGRSVKDCR